MHDPLPLTHILNHSEILPRDFYARATVDVARECLGKLIVHGATAGRIVEVEAYLGLEDLAAHASRGITDRTRVLYGPPGHAYVYFIYGMYDCLNFVAEPDGTPGGILIRALEPLSGLAEMQLRRPKARRVEDLASGPGRLALAMGITRKLNGVDLVDGLLTVHRLQEEPQFDIAAGPRIGITQCADLPLRFYINGNRFVSR